MPLDKDGLASALTQVAADPPPTSAECAQAWADAMKAYAENIVPVSGAVSTAAGELASDLAAAFNSGAAAPLMETAFSKFAGTVGGGMVGYTPTPPPAPVGFATQFLSPFPETHPEAGSAIADLVHGWMTTGKATPSGGGAPQDWV